MASSANFNCSELAEFPALIRFCESTQSRDEEWAADMDNFFIVWASALVLFMHAGFAMLSAGALRSKNNRNILLSIIMDLCACALAWYLIGFAFAFGDDRGGFIGATNWVGIDVGSEPTGVLSFNFWLFEFCFAATAATIVSGAVAERCRFETYLLTSFYMSAWVYVVVVHWVWGGGFLTLGNHNGQSLMQSGVVDFAGCGPVHMVGGVAGAIGSKIMGPRMGRFDPSSGKPMPIPGHSSPLATLGVFVLWVGWMGFNCGSVLNLSGGGGVVAARAGVNTILSSAMGALSSMFYGYFSSHDRDFDLGMSLNGALAGLVSVTGCCAYIEMWAAVCVGVVGGILYVSSSRFTLHVLKIDDPLDATPVHLFCGMWGIVAGAFFANPRLLAPHFVPTEANPIMQVPSGVFYGGNTYVTKNLNGSETPGGDILGALVANAVVEIVCVVAWVGVFTIPFFSFFQYMGLLRVEADIEAMGLDASHHGGNAYPELFHAYEYNRAEELEKQSLLILRQNSATNNNTMAGTSQFEMGTSQFEIKQHASSPRAPGVPSPKAAAAAAGAATEEEEVVKEEQPQKEDLAVV
ncbi:hypothetical protein BASA81_001145 [Batrachochytrium salamandrivorans]|nr:hypothetical protein BASA81_001145 [Batrachochytrium salamandrivorans]